MAACDSHFHVFGPEERYPYSTELRYRPPFSTVVDVLEPDGEGWHGRATVFGRTLGEFRMSRRAT